MSVDQFFTQGWCLFDHDPVLANWVRQTLPAARTAVANPIYQQWLRHQGSWFVGVNALPNDQTGAVPGGPALEGIAVDFIRPQLGFNQLPWDQAQVSVCYPGYPRQGENESEAAHRYRNLRDAAHIDGLLRRGPKQRRYLGEQHAFILGIPMTEASKEASPFVIWEGSHILAKDTFQAVLGEVDPAQWDSLDLTDVYHNLRRKIFDCCRRLEIAAVPGQAYIAHRLCLHGMAPWGEQAKATADGRMICYFRPEVAEKADWLSAP